MVDSEHKRVLSCATESQNTVTSINVTNAANSVAHVEEGGVVNYFQNCKFQVS